MAVMIIHEAHHQSARPKDRAVFPHVPAFVESAPTCRGGGELIFGNVLCYVGRGENESRIFSDDIVATVTEHFLSAGVPGDDTVLKISGKDRVARNTLHHPAIPFVARDRPRLVWGLAHAFRESGARESATGCAISMADAPRSIMSRARQLRRGCIG